MKKALLLLCCVLTGLVTYAQMFSTNQGTSNNYFPFGATGVGANNKVQWLYVPSDFTTAPPAGTITRVYFRTWNGQPTYNGTYTNFSIKMANSILTNFGVASTAGYPFITPMTTVYANNPEVVAATPQFTWFSFTLQNPFPYTGGSLIVEIEQTAMTGYLVANCQQGPAACRRIYATSGSLTGTSNTTMGDLGIDMLLSCDSPININTVPTRFTADITWDPRPGATSYEYLIDQSPLNPPSSGYNFTNSPVVNLKNLPDGTCYYIHVRTICGSSMMSGWSLDSFCTIADCKVPVVTMSNILSTTAIASWDAVPGATGYVYSVGTTPDTPTTGNSTTYTSVKLQGLWPDKPLYFYVRAKCSPTPQSEWGVTPFHTEHYTGVEDIDNSLLSLEAFPNPVKDVMQLKIHGRRGNNAAVMMTDITGRIVHRQAVDAAVLYVNMSGFPAGTYYIKYTDDNHNELIKVTRQ